jgi:hypothetical protein
VSDVAGTGGCVVDACDEFRTVGISARVGLGGCAQFVVFGYGWPNECLV